MTKYPRKFHICILKVEPFIVFSNLKKDRRSPDQTTMVESSRHKPVLESRVPGSSSIRSVKETDERGGVFVFQLCGVWTWPFSVKGKHTVLR